ncbi:hypothetical protein OSB04_001106 [Centaurea solstitialis]|uniref:CCHC-type domain-containing protein n=1 Tax=Centaurea solstitialis TaxID=347529 RepID=A0AA38TQD8_9ASTR|nr:hypothetical protein OSB04_001106 [Centaurea solstitialis]
MSVGAADGGWRMDFDRTVVVIVAAAFGVFDSNRRKAVIGGDDDASHVLTVRVPSLRREQPTTAPPFVGAVVFDRATGAGNGDGGSGVNQNRRWAGVVMAFAPSLLLTPKHGEASGSYASFEAFSRIDMRESGMCLKSHLGRHLRQTLRLLPEMPTRSTRMIACLMLATMSPDLQAGLINTNAYDMIRQLRDMFQTQARTERYDATKAFNECKMVKGTSLATDTILNSLSEDYRPFVVNYNMNNMEKTIAELHSMLKTTELNMGNKNKTKDVLMVKDGGVKKKNGQASTSKGKGPVQAIQSAPKKGKSKGKGKKVKPNKARTENRCFICNEIGHWRQNYPKRHEAGRNHSSTQQLRKVAVLHIQELEVSPGSYDQLLNNSYKCCRLKVAQIFDRVANIGRDPRLRLLLGINSTRRTFVGRSPVNYHQAIQMESTVTSTNNLSLRSILEKDKLTGSNFLDWERNMMIVLRHERKWYVLEEPLGEAPPANAPAAARNAHKKHSDDLLDVACLMLATMSPDLQAGLINTNAYDMIRQLRDMFQTQARTERYDATKAFNECKMVKGTSVSDHIMKMKRHLDHLERLGHPIPLQLATDTILNSLSEDYRPFVVNYNMNNMEKSIAELHSMLKTVELNLGNKNKTKDVLMVRDGGVKKKNGHASTSKGKGQVQAVQSAPKKGKGKGKGKKVKPNKARTENRCFTCNEVGHWRQNCPKRHEAGSYDQLLNNSYKRCRLKVAQIFDRVANIGRDPQLRLLLGISHK